MNIAVDIDDTLADTFDYYIPFVAEFFGADEEDLRRRNISYNTLPPEWSDRDLELGMAYDDKYVPDTPFKPDAAEGINALRAMGHRIFIITARCDQNYRDPVGTTKKELENGKIVYDKLICTLNKAAACTAEKIDILIDDCPANCLAAAAVGVSPIVFSSKAYPNPPSEFPLVFNWTQTVETVKKIAVSREKEMIS